MKKLYFILGLSILTGYTQQSIATPYQSISSILEASRHYIVTHLTAEKDYKIKLEPIDNRLKLPLCDKTLIAFTAKSSLKPGRNSIGVKCTDKKKWTVYTSAFISLFKDVIVLTQPIRRGEFYTENMLHFEKKEVSGLRKGYFTDSDNIINKQASRNLSIGSVITQANITEPKLVKRGEKVTIKISSPNLVISAAGIALMDGVQNQNIRIKNIRSQQIVQATVVDQGQVVVTF